MTRCDLCPDEYIADLALAHADHKNICYCCRDRLGLTFKECDRADAQIYYNVHKKRDQK
jgi:hypothetical protein